MTIGSGDVTNKGFFNLESTKRWIKLILILLIGSHLMYMTIRSEDSYPNGDGPEYILMTEAIYNHASPEIRLSDYESFKENITKYRPWDHVGKFFEFNDYEKFLRKTDHPFKDFEMGIFSAKNGNSYFYHFFAYSIINIPVRFISDINHFYPIRTFPVTNAILILISLFFLLYYSPFRLLPTIFISLSFVFSSVYWYIGWPSPEVFTTCLVTLSFWFYFQGKRIMPIFLLSIAAMQNQPVVLLAAYMSLVVLYERGLKPKVLLQLFFANVLVLLPPLYFLYHFDTTNLIKDTGILSWHVVTWNRIYGFYTDLNQGMILVIPLLLTAYPVLWFRELFHAIKNKEFRHHLLIPFFLLAMISIFCTMINWNHGMAVINRYATWSSAVLMIHAFFMMKDFQPIKQTIIIASCFALQLASVLFNNKYYNYLDWDQNKNKPWAKWVYENLPSIYNPDANIFFVRTSKNYNFIPEQGPVAYLSESGEMCKMLIHRDHMNKLLDWGVAENQIDSVKSTKKYINGWTYINKGELPSKFTPEQFLELKKEIRVKALIEDMLRHEEWYATIVKKAEENKVSVEEMLRLDAIYLYNEEQKK